MYYKKKPVVIQAIQWDGYNHDEIFSFTEGKASFGVEKGDKPSMFIDTLEGRMSADIGDFIIKGIKGEFYPCKPDVFSQSYELLDMDSV